MKTYLRPEVYERLAMEYTLGIMPRRVESRFETLMVEHPYIEVFVEGFQYKFGTLVELLPEEKPHARVWASIKSSLDASETEQSRIRETDSELSSWWNLFSLKSIAIAFSFLLAILIIFPLNNTNEAIIISSELVSVKNESMVEVVAKKSDMMMLVKFKKEVDVPDGMQLALWCYHKKSGQKPVNMGTLVSEGATRMKLDNQMWKDMVNSSRFEVSFEPINSKVDNPTGEILFKGKLVTSTKH